MIGDFLIKLLGPELFAVMCIMMIILTATCIFRYIVVREGKDDK